LEKKKEINVETKGQPEVEINESVAPGAWKTGSPGATIRVTISFNLGREEVEGVTRLFRENLFQRHQARDGRGW